MASPLSFRLCRRLALCLALAALLASLAAPLQARPLDRAAPAGPIAGLIEWVQGLLQSTGVTGGAAADHDQGLEAAFAPEGQCMDPIGNTIPCPKTVTPAIPTEFSLTRAEPEGNSRTR